MQQKIKKLMAFMCMLVMIVTAIPAVPASAATDPTLTKPTFTKTYKGIYENGVSNGKYTYTLQDLTKGQTVKWSVTGEGKSYVTVKVPSKKAAGTTMKNIIYVNTGGKTAAKNKKITLIAQVYSKAGKLQYTAKTTARIKVKTKKITMTTPPEFEDVLRVGQTYKFGYKLTPANSTATNVWAVTNAEGEDCSSYMSSTGTFRPMKAGTYKIVIQSKIDDKVIKSATAVAEVVDYMVSAEQQSANKVQLAYSGDIRGNVNLKDIVVKNSLGTTIEPRDITFSEDGTKATVTMYSNFKDGAVYTVSDGNSAQEFKASVGIPVRLEVLTSTATVNKETNIQYALYDANNIDVTVAYPGNIIYTPEITNGYITKENKLFMSTVGSTGTIKLEYTNKNDKTNVLVGVGVVTCVAAVTSADTNFTLVTSTDAPDFTAEGYADNRKVAIGTNYTAFFRALDTDKSVLKYDSISYQSTDPDTLIISSTGKVTPIRTGTVRVIVTAVYAGETYTYAYDVTIAEAPYMSKVNLSQTSVVMSNVYHADYKEFIDVSAVDQYGDDYPLTNEIVSFIDNSVYKANLVSYNAATNQIEVKASAAIPGTYRYAMTISSGDKKLTQDLTVIVSAIPATGETTYQIEIDKNSVDMALNTDVAGSQFVNVRLAQYRAGLFTNYAMYTKATIKKGSDYYGTDLTIGGKTTEQVQSASNNLTLKVMDITGDTCKKAEKGTYTIELQYYSSDDKAYKTLTTNLTLTDTQSSSTKVRVLYTTATAHCDNALDLAKNCLAVDNGTITECVVTGEKESGSKVTVKAGEQVNINLVTITNTYKIAGNQTVVVNATVYVGKTLTNI